MQTRWVLSGILLVAILIRFWNLDQPKMSADESLHYFPEMQTVNRLSFDHQRHHPTDLYHATPPNPIGHPLFAVQVANLVMQLLAPTPTVGRGVMAAAGVLLVGVIYLLGRDLFDRRYGLVAAAMAAIVPLAVRYNRTMYLDSIYALLTALLIWLLVRTFSSRNPKWFLAAGVVLGLAGATKSSAPFLIPLIIGYGVFWWWQSCTTPATPQQFTLPVWVKLASILLIGFIVFYIFVDPGSYLHAIRYPVDPSYQNRTIVSYIVLLWQARDWLLGVALYLWTPPLLIAALAGLVMLVRHEWRKPSHVLILMVLWLFCFAPLIPLHLRGLSGEHGYISFVAPVTLLAAFAVMQLKRLWLTISFVVIMATMLPATILFGHRLMLLPYNSYLNGVDRQTNLSLPDEFGEYPYPIQDG
jgi:4-amino-4-deoxy-L-arabinose transferase-like glycosyltransferase